MGAAVEDDEELLAALAQPSSSVRNQATRVRLVSSEQISRDPPRAGKGFFFRAQTQGEVLGKQRLRMPLVLRRTPSSGQSCPVGLVDHNAAALTAEHNFFSFNPTLLPFSGVSTSTLPCRGDPFIAAARLRRNSSF